MFTRSERRHHMVFLGIIKSSFSYPQVHIIGIPGAGPDATIAIDDVSITPWTRISSGMSSVLKQRQRQQRRQQQKRQ